MVDDPLVLPATQPANLLYPRIVKGSLTLRSNYLSGGFRFTEGVDYTVDYARGTVARTPESRIPDFSKNVLYGQKNFNQSVFPGYGNARFTVYVDYRTTAFTPLATPTEVAHLLRGTAEKLRNHQPLKLVAFGDSIAAGGEASTEFLRFTNKYADYLQKRFPQSQITLENTATGGDTTVQGLQRLGEKVLSRKPDLVLLAFGMNDHNVPSVGGTPLPQFEANLREMIRQIRDKTRAEIILISPFPPNSNWMFSSHQMEKYAAATEQLAREEKVAYADVYSAWTKLLKRKSEESLLANNINHPNNFGHDVYFQVLKAMRF
ncbi:MAG TPA: SGNH/GDSL hydrolase family protein [Tepidisphaeraceae bacterium]